MRTEFYVCNADTGELHALSLHQLPNDTWEVLLDDHTLSTHPTYTEAVLAAMDPEAYDNVT